MPTIITDKNRINEVLTRGVENIYPDKEALKKVLLSGKRIRLYCGFDPSAPALHIGNATLINKLAQFQALGHEVIFLIGDFTGMIGDPTDKSAARVTMTRAQVRANSKNYKKQASAYLKFSGANPAKIMHNSQWSDKISFKDLINITSNFTVQQMIDRDMFQKRFYGEVKCKKCGNIFTPKTQKVDFGEQGCVKMMHVNSSPYQCPYCGDNDLKDIVHLPKPIYLHEFLYPVAQGYDSVGMDVNLEIGGNDQMFNMLCGRELVKVYKKKEKFVLTMKLLADERGHKMSKSEGNVVFMDDAPDNMYGKIMSWPDGIIGIAFELCTTVPGDEVKKIYSQLKNGHTNPRDLKMKLAFNITNIIHGEKAARDAQERFVKTFQKKETPGKISNFQFQISNIKLVDALVETKLAFSKNEAKRLIEQGGVKVDNEVINDANAVVEIKEHGTLMQRGKRQFVKIFFNRSS